MSPECTIVIPTYNNPEGAIELVEDIYRLHGDDLFRIISIDQTRDGIPFRDKKPHLHIKTYRNLGFSKAQNTGWKLSTTPYTLLANDDIRLFHARWYEDAKQHFRSDDVLAVNPFPALRTWNGGGDPKWYWDIHGEKFAWTKDKPYESYTEEDYLKLQKLLFSGCPGGTAMFFTLLKTKTRDIVGLLDESYINNGEDYDLNRRIYLTCKHCQKPKYTHTDIGDDKWICPTDPLGSLSQSFEPYKILTCTHSMIHHHCGVTKQKAAAAKEISGYDSVLKAKNIFNNKWRSDTESNPDIYGKTGSSQPNVPWYTEIPL